MKSHSVSDPQVIVLSCLNNHNHKAPQSCENLFQVSGKVRFLTSLNKELKVYCRALRERVD